MRTPKSAGITRAPSLGRYALFQSLPSEVLQHLQAACTEIRHAKGEPVYRELESPGHLWLVKTGRVRLVRYSSTGRTFAMHTVGEGGVFCIPAVVNGCPYPCRAVAETDTVLLKVPAAKFHELLTRHPVLGYEALKLISRECCRAHALCSAGQERAEQRLANILAQLLEVFGTTIPLNRQQVAELAGMTRETANRILSKWQRQQLVSLAFQQLTVRDPAAFRA